MLKKIQDLETQAKCLLDDNQQKLLIKKPLSQLEEESKRLRKKIPQKVIQNQYYNKMARNINKLKTYKLKQQMGTLEEREPTDITGYLNDNYKNILVFSWKEAIQETEKKFQKRMEDTMNLEWEKTKRKLLSNIELGYNLKTEKSFISSTPSKRMNPSTPIGKNITIDFSTPNRSFQTSSYPLSPSTPNLDYSPNVVNQLDLSSSFISDTEKIIVEKYSQGVANFLKNEKTTDPLTVIKNFALLSERTISNERNQSILTICWRLLIFMFSHLGKIEEIRNLMEKDPKKVTKQMIENTKNFLEDQYSEYVKNVLLSNSVSRGGNPNEHKTISMFADLMVKKVEGVKKDSNFAPLWPVVYYLLRVGKKDEAKRVVFESDCEVAIKNCFEYYCSSNNEKRNKNRNVVENIFDSVSKIYKITKTEINYAEDQKYKLAVLNIISHCEDINASRSSSQNSATFKQLTRDIFKTTEDFIWLHLNFVEDSENVLETGITFPLSKLQKTLRDFESKFKEHSPLLYFQVLLMSQQFELALREISNREYIMECTHFAIVLEYFGVLKYKEFDYPLQIQKFIKSYHQGNYLNALRYYFMIRNESLRNVYLYDLISTNFELYFGDDKNVGVLPQFYQHYELNPNEIHKIRLYCAEKSESEGKLFDAVRLFYSCKEFEKVFELLVKLVSIDLLDFSLPKTENTLLFARNFIDKLPRIPSIIYYGSLHLLIQIFPFYFYFHKGDFQNAISEAEKTNLLSFEITYENTNKQRSLTLKNHSQVIGKNISDFFKKVSYSLHQLVNLSRSKMNSKAENQYKSKLEALINFSTYFRDDKNIHNLDLF